MAKKPNDVNVGERIRYIIGPLTMPEFGKEIGVTRNTKSYWENNICMPLCEALIQLNKKFNVNIDRLLTGKGEPYLREIDNMVLKMDSRLSTLGKRVNKLAKRKKS